MTVALRANIDRKSALSDGVVKSSPKWPIMCRVGR